MCVLAESFARIFFRNSINIGLPVLECREISSKIEEGDELVVDLKKGLVQNKSKNSTLHTTQLPGFILEILSDEGLVEHLRRTLK